MEKTERLSTGTRQPTEGNAPKNTSFAPVCGVLPSSTRIVSLHKHKGVSYEEQIARVLSSILTCSIPPLIRCGRMDAAAQSEQYDAWNSICSTGRAPPGLNKRRLSS